MAVAEFYLQTTGSNVNAGSTSSDSASVTSTNGNWSTVTNVFTPAGGGTPFSGVSAGEYAHIYVDGGSAIVYVAQIASVNSGGATITLSTTIVYGTPPSTSATARSCKVGGAWASLAVITSLSGITPPQSTRINVKAGTYANTTTSRTFNWVGSTSGPIFVRGYNLAIGDLDNDFTTAKPSITFTTGQFGVSGAHHILSNLDISGQCVSTAQVRVTGGAPRFVHCRMTNTAANASGRALSTSAAVVIACKLTANATATTVADVGDSSVMEGCVVRGGGVGITMTGPRIRLKWNLIAGPTGVGISFGATAVSNIDVTGNTVYNTGSHGVDITVVLSGSCEITNNVIGPCTGYAISSSGGTTNYVARLNNVAYNCSSGAESGFGDSPAYGTVTTSTDPWTNAAGDDFSLTGASAARAVGFPGPFEGETFVGYTDSGAVQRQEPTPGRAAVVQANTWAYAE